MKNQAENYQQSTTSEIWQIMYKNENTVVKICWLSKSSTTDCN